MVVVDAHVHFHEGFDLDRFFGAAAANFARATRGSGATGVLMLAECRGVRCFDAWYEQVGAGGYSTWSFARTAEPDSLEVRHPDGRKLLLIAGHQLVTAERLEVLALGVRRELEDGGSLTDTIERVREAGGLPVLAWGVGKWTGKRGRAVVDAIARSNGRPLFVGDNGGRWRGLPKPGLLVRAEREGLPVLPGSDPLPLPDQELRVGAFGFSLAGALDERAPARGLRDALGTRPAIEPYGSATSLARFLAQQWAMQLRRRRRASAS